MHTVKSVKRVGKWLEVTFKSRSGKSTWKSFFDFHDAAEIVSSSCSYDARYPYAVANGHFVDEVRKFMKQDIENKLMSRWDKTFLVFH